MPDDKPPKRTTRITPRINTTVKDSTRRIMERAMREMPDARTLSGVIEAWAADWAARNPPKGG